MLKKGIVHEGILALIAKCGHGDKILITDGNYPIHTETNENTQKVIVGLMAEIPTVTDTLSGIIQHINVEEALVMDDESVNKPEIFEEFKDILNFDKLDKASRFDFYQQVKNSPNIVIAINTADTRTFANILLTVGVA